MLTVNLHDNVVVAPELIGGKAASLLGLISLHAIVPHGFCITTTAYAHHLHSLLLEQAYPGRFSGASSLSIEDLSSLRGRIEEGELADELRQAIMTALEDLRKRCLYVPLKTVIRSSANIEDLPAASFAGQYDTFLNVVHEDTIIERVKQCWSSVWSERAYSYRAKNGFNHWQTRMAVIVQELIPAEVAGTLFTANPVTGNLNETIIEASWGLGELAVSGQVTPDTYFIRTDTASPVITKRLIGKKLNMLSAHPDEREGTIETKVSTDKVTAQALSDELMLDLVRQGAYYSRHYSYPCDIEWAWYKGQLHMLQVRPLTALMAQRA